MPLLSRTFTHVATCPQATINAVIDESYRRLERAEAALQVITRTILESLRVLETSERKLRDLEARPAMTFRSDRPGTVHCRIVNVVSAEANQGGSQSLLKRSG